MKLFDETLHESLIKTTWSVDKAHETIHLIMSQAIDSFDEDNLWPVHPDLTATYNFTKPIGCLWFGAAGTMLVLKHLHNVESSLPAYDFSPFVDNLWPKQRESLHELNDMLSCDVESPGYLLGESTINWIAYKITHDEQYLDRLYLNIVSNTRNPANELMWGSPGTMLVALFAYEQTKDEKWLTLYQQSAAYLFETLLHDRHNNIHYWQQTMYGFDSKHIGLVHGFTGNYFALQKGAQYLSKSQQKRLIDTALTALTNSAISDDQYANWLPALEKCWDGSDKPFLQLCHGSPSTIFGYVDFWPFMQTNHRDLLCKAGELIWHAGPLIKPWGICHGTAGNGWAFLKLAHLTGNDLWLHRARCFAMHAISQFEAMFEQYGQIRTDFWCGDLGLALYLQACLYETHEFLSLDHG